MQALPLGGLVVSGFAPRGRPLEPVARDYQDEEAAALRAPTSSIIGDGTAASRCCWITIVRTQVHKFCEPRSLETI
jgi:hypothetical protein